VEVVVIMVMIILLVSIDMPQEKIGIVAVDVTIAVVDTTIEMAAVERMNLEAVILDRGSDRGYYEREDRYRR